VDQLQRHSPEPTDGSGVDRGAPRTTPQSGGFAGIF
jgi:hypothetical protein